MDNFLRISSSNDLPQRRSNVLRQPFDLDFFLSTQLPEAEEVENSFGYWLLSDASSRNRLREAAERYDLAQFCSIVAPLLQSGGHAWKEAISNESLDGLHMSQYLENNHNSLSEWLHAKLNGIRKDHSGRLLRLQDATDQALSKTFFRELRQRLSKHLMLDNPMQHIESVIGALDIDDLGEASFDIAWNLKHYIHDEMGASHSLGSMLTFTGSVDAAWAATAELYVEKVWPQTGLIILSAVEKSIKDGKTTSAFDGDFGVIVREATSRRRNQESNELAHIKVQGTKRQIVEAAQQLAWMMGVFRTPSPDIADAEEYSQFEIVSLSNKRFLLRPLQPQKAPDGPAACWLPVLHGNAIAQGFPIPPREGEKGLEIFLDAAAPLAGIQYPVYTKDIIVLRGWCSLMYPVKASADFGSIQWHLVMTDDPDDPQITDTSSSITYVPNWRDVSLGHLSTSRSFIGFCDVANIPVGTASYDTQVSGNLSGAVPEKSRAYWAKKVVVNMGTSGMGAWGLGAGGEINFTRTARAHMGKRANFDLELKTSQKTPVLMYDVATCTAWLVPELSLVLHMARSWFLEYGDLADEEVDKLPSAEISDDGGSAAIEAINRNESLKLERVSGKPWKFIDIIKDAIHLLAACKYSRDPTESSTSFSWLKSWFTKPKLYGWDLADLVDSRDYTLRKEISMVKNSGDPWISKIANHPNVLLVFCKNIPRPIRPAEPKKICRKWNPIPQGENYFVAPIRTLRALGRSCNGGDNGRQLTEQCYWSCPEGSDPWGACDYGSSKGCNRLQVIVESDPTRPKKQKIKGAVVFGSTKFKRAKCRPPKKLKPAKAASETEAEAEAVHADTEPTEKAESPLPIEASSPPPDVEEDLHTDGMQSDSTGEIFEASQYEEEYEALAVALAQKYDKQQKPDDLNDMIRLGRTKIDQYDRLSQRLGKQKELMNTLTSTLEDLSRTLDD